MMELILPSAGPARLLSVVVSVCLLFGLLMQLYSQVSCHNTLKGKPKEPLLTEIVFLLVGGLSVDLLISCDVK